MTVTTDINTPRNQILRHVLDPGIVGEISELEPMNGDVIQGAWLDYLARQIGHHSGVANTALDHLRRGRENPGDVALAVAPSLAGEFLECCLDVAGVADRDGNEYRSHCCCFATNRDERKPTMQSGSITLGDVVRRIDVVVVACCRCDPAGEYPLVTLIGPRAPAYGIPMLPWQLSADCPKRKFVSACLQSDRSLERRKLGDVQIFRTKCPQKRGARKI